MSTKNLIAAKTLILKRIMLPLFCFCLLSLTPIAVLSQNASETGDPVEIYKQAGIGADQEASIRKLAQDYDQENLSRLESLAKMLEELRNMAYQKTLDESGMLAKQEEINKLQSDMALQRIKLVIKIRGLLTPEQNEKLVSVLQNRTHSEEQTKLK